MTRELEGIDFLDYERANIFHISSRRICQKTNPVKVMAEYEKELAADKIQQRGD